MLQSSPTQLYDDAHDDAHAAAYQIYLDHLADCVQTSGNKMQLKSEIIQMATTRSVKVQPPTTAGFRGGWRETKLLQRSQKTPIIINIWWEVVVQLEWKRCCTEIKGIILPTQSL